MRTTYGSPLFADHVPEHDSLLVERLRAAGAMIIGKTNTPEFGAGSQTFNEVFGATRNPYDLTKTPGGSSRRRRGRRRGGHAAVRRRLGPRRERPQPRRVLQPRRPAPVAGPDPDAPARAIRGTRSPSTARSRARAPDAALLFEALAGPDPRDPLSIQERVHRELRAGHRRCGSPGAATSAACRSSPR